MGHFMPVYQICPALAREFRRLERKSVPMEAGNNSPYPSKRAIFCPAGLKNPEIWGVIWDFHLAAGEFFSPGCRRWRDPLLLKTCFHSRFSRCSSRRSQSVCTMVKYLPAVCKAYQGVRTDGFLMAPALKRVHVMPARRDQPARRQHAGACPPEGADGMPPCPTGTRCPFGRGRAPFQTGMRRPAGRRQKGPCARLTAGELWPHGRPHSSPSSTPPSTPVMRVGRIWLCRSSVPGTATCI